MTREQVRKTIARKKITERRGFNETIKQIQSCRVKLGNILDSGRPKKKRKEGNKTNYMSKYDKHLNIKYDKI